MPLKNINENQDIFIRIGDKEYVPINGVSFIESNKFNVDEYIDKQCEEQTTKLLEEEKEFLNDADYDKVFEEEYKGIRNKFFSVKPLENLTIELKGNIKEED